MLKAYSIYLVLLIPFLLGSQSSFAQYRLTHERFVHYRHDQKKEIIRQTMQLIVDIESRYRYESQKKNPNKERLKKYTLLLKSVQDFLLPAAHANSGRSYQSQLSNFTELLKNPDRCIYGGWISSLRNGKCTHPLNLSSSSPERQSYIKTGCRHPSEISCNPLVFGFKEISKSSVFCVPAGPRNNNADNAALNCMKKALADPNEGDSSDQRLSYLAAELSQNPAMSKSMHNFISKACICDAPPRNLNKNYHGYMRPHRTCYGLMQTIAAATEACTTPPIGEENLTMIQSLRSAVAPSLAITGENIDEHYSSFLNVLEGTKEFKALCESSSKNGDDEQSSDSDQDGENGEASSRPDGSNPGNSGGNNSGSNAGGNSPGSNSDGSNNSGSNPTGNNNGAPTNDQGAQARDPETSTDTATDTPADGSQTDNSGGGLVVSTNPAGPTTTPGNSPSTPGGGSSNSGNTTGSPGTGSDTTLPATSGDASTGEDPVNESTSQYQVEVTILDQDVTSATLSLTKPTEVPTGVTIVWFAKSDEGESLDDITPPTEFTPPEASTEAAEETTTEEETIPPTVAAPVTNVPDELNVEGERRFEIGSKHIKVTKREQDFDMCVKLVKDSVKVSNTACVKISTEVENNNSEESADNYTLTLSATTKTTKVDIKATISGHESLPSGISIFWFERLTPPAPKAPRADSEEEAPTLKTLEELKSSGITSKKESTLTLTVDQKNIKYQVCAQLFKGSKPASTEECETISKKKADADKKKNTPAAGGGMPPAGPQLPPPIRGGGDVILRGVY